MTNLPGIREDLRSSTRYFERIVVSLSLVLNMSISCEFVLVDKFPA